MILSFDWEFRKLLREIWSFALLPVFLRFRGGSKSREPRSIDQLSLLKALQEF